MGTGLQGLPEGPYEIVISNIISATLIVIAHEVSDVVRAGGSWVVSGIIESNWQDVREAAERVGFTLDSFRQEDDWVAASFRMGA